MKSDTRSTIHISNPRFSEYSPLKKLRVGRAKPQLNSTKLGTTADTKDKVARIFKSSFRTTSVLRGLDSNTTVWKSDSQARIRGRAVSEDLFKGGSHTPSPKVGDLSSGQPTEVSHKGIHSNLGSIKLSSSTSLPKLDSEIVGGDPKVDQGNSSLIERKNYLPKVRVSSPQKHRPEMPFDRDVSTTAPSESPTERSPVIRGLQPKKPSNISRPAHLIASINRVDYIKTCLQRCLEDVRVKPMRHRYMFVMEPKQPAVAKTEPLREQQPNTDKPSEDLDSTITEPVLKELLQNSTKIGTQLTLQQFRRLESNSLNETRKSCLKSKAASLEGSQITLIEENNQSRPNTLKRQVSFSENVVMFIYQA